MGRGISGICNKRGKEETFYLGCGMQYLFAKSHVLFVCPKCGTWKESLIKDDNNRKRKCKNCNTMMKKITSDKLDAANETPFNFVLSFKKLPYLKTLKCKNCDGLLVISKNIILWD